MNEYTTIFTNFNSNKRSFMSELRVSWFNMLNKKYIVSSVGFFWLTIIKKSSDVIQELYFLYFQ